MSSVCSGYILPLTRKHSSCASVAEMVGERRDGKQKGKRKEGARNKREIRTRVSAQLKYIVNNPGFIRSR